MRGLDLCRLRTRAVGHEPLRRGRDGAVLARDQVPRRNGLPRWAAGGTPKASSENGRCVANMRSVVRRGRSAANAVLKLGSSRMSPDDLIEGLDGTSSLAKRRASHCNLTKLARFEGDKQTLSGRVRMDAVSKWIATSSWPALIA